MTLVIHERVWQSVWAKSDCDDFGQLRGWLPLYQHLDDSAGVAGLLVDHWVSPQVVRRIGSELPDGDVGVRQVACWLAGVHDVGKASPAFAVQVPRLADYMRRFGLDASPSLASHVMRRRVGHALVGQLAVRDWLAEQLGFGFRGTAAQWASIVGSHHGVPPESTDLRDALDRVELVGSGSWSQVRTLLLDRATQRSGGREVLARYQDAGLSLPSQALLTAIVILADWIASNTDLFPLRSLAELDDPPRDPDDAVTADRIAAGWDALNLPARWTPQPVDMDIDQFFRLRFVRHQGLARPVQAAAVAEARSLTEPGMLIIEAPMGSGKTEAALLAAEVLAYRSGADGCFVALPTQATSDAMFGRVREWLATLSDTAMSVSLAHGRAHLNDEFRGILHRGRTAQVGDDNEDAAVAHWWLRGRKKSSLASFVVGTIDQVLFAGLKSRHLMLRHLALAGKVVIIDEVHAYDVYMSQYLHRVLQWLGAYRVPVVLLSATLPDARRAELLRAYDGNHVVYGTDHPGYPVVCASGGRPPRSVPLAETPTTVVLDRLSDDLDSLVAYLRRHLVMGGCAAVVRNTVSRVQETAERLSAEFGDDQVTINHSRFVACDRARKDRDLLRRFGPPDQGRKRPSLHIVVASQVVEQSLDVDFDLMVTDLAPVDLVLQRLGRLHRHDRDRPESVRQAHCALVGVEDWLGEPATAVPGSRTVYGRFPLLRAAAMFLDRGELGLPHDIAPMVQLAYGDDRVGPPPWRTAMNDAERDAAIRAKRRADAAATFLLGTTASASTLVGWLRANVGDTEDSPQGLAQVRDGEESLEVLVVQRDADGGLLVPDWIGRNAGTQIPLDQEIPGWLARTIAACTLRLPPALSHSRIISTVITELENLGRIASFTRSPMLNGQLVLPLDQGRRADLGGYQLTYDLRRGLLHDKR
jgi:CRISPR-associated helicase Cas3/CRISPR-associated endonuclease Cas3-HD